MYNLRFFYHISVLDILSLLIVLRKMKQQNYYFLQRNKTVITELSLCNLYV